MTSYRQFEANRCNALKSTGPKTQAGKQASLDRFSRYEATLWRQAGRILFTLDALDRRKPKERNRLISNQHGGWPMSAMNTKFRGDPTAS